ncbi:hypothetical protein J801_4663, partial [Acinetobacter baumannii 45002_8]
CVAYNTGGSALLSDVQRTYSFLCPELVSIWLIEYNHSSALSPHGLFSPISSVDFVESFFCSRLS